MNNYKITIRVGRNENDFIAIENVQASHMAEAIEIGRKRTLNEHHSWNAKVLKAVLIEDPSTMKD